MKKLIYLFLASFFFLGYVKADFNAQDLVPNGGFENGIAGDHNGNLGDTAIRDTTITNWSFDAGDVRKDAVFTIVTSGPHSGSLCLQMKLPTNAENDYAVQATNAFIHTVPDSFYRYSAWCKVADTACNLNFTIGEYGTWSELNRIGNWHPGTSWGKIVFGFQATRDSLRAPLHPHKAGTYYIDDFVVVKSDAAIAEIVPSGDTLNLAFGYQLAALSADFDPATITVKINGTADPIDGIVIGKRFGTTMLQLHLSTAVSGTDVVTVSYVPPAVGQLAFDLAYAGDYDNLTVTDVTSFTDEPVDNLAGPVGIKGVSARSNLRISQYPGKVVIVSGLTNESNLRVYNTLGQQVYKNVYVNHDEKVLNLQNLTSGIYIIVQVRPNGIKDAVKLLLK